jgi:hypothetical protein
MTKPSLSSLEIVALSNRLDILVLQGRTSPPESKRFYEEQMKPLVEEYKRLSGNDYVFIEKREID